MNKKMILISIGAVVIALMMVSSATATLQHIDSNIKITKRYEQKLTDAYNNIDDVDFKDFKILLGKIIDLSKTKKVVNSADIKKIIEDNTLAVSGVYVSRGINTGDFCPGGCGPHIIRLYWGMCMFWKADAGAIWPSLPINVRVGPDTYTGNHQGLAVSYFGVAWNADGFDMQHGAQCKFTMGGFGFLIIVS